MYNKDYMKKAVQMQQTWKTMMNSTTMLSRFAEADGFLGYVF
jgi:hypothetical protein